jgi:ribonuclease I
MKEIEQNATVEKVSIEQALINKKNELKTEIIQMRNQERINCLKEIEMVCSKYQFKLDAELIINSQGNHTNVFLVDISK